MTNIDNSKKLLWTIVAFSIAFFVWAGITRLDEVTRSQGRVVSSSQLQVVQNLEGGIVAEILVRPGDIVQADDTLIRLDRTQFRSELSSSRQQHAMLEARAARLTAFSEANDIVFPEEFESNFPDIARSERALHRANVEEHQALLLFLNSKLVQRQQERDEALAKSTSAARTAALTKQEISILEPLVEKGVEPRLELIRARQRAESASAEAASGGAQAERLSEAVNETENEIAATDSRYRAEAMGELGDIRAELSQLSETLPAIQDRVSRADVKSPIDGVVNQVHVATVGGVVKPGMPLVEIVPNGDTLLIEAQVRPEDIAFLFPGQDARVKLTAYDFAVFGSLKGKVETIGADAVPINNDGGMAYLVQIRTDEATLTNNGRSLPILPGMVAEVDILSGKKTILNYILSPVTRIKERAFRER